MVRGEQEATASLSCRVYGQQGKEEIAKKPEFAGHDSKP
jgi:hypothetical protein